MSSRLTRVLACALSFGWASSTALVSFAPAADVPAASEKGPGCTPVMKNPERHEQFMRHKEWLIKHGGTQFVLLGDSITDGWHNGEARDILEEHFGKYAPYNTGIGGDQTQHLLWRIDNGELDGISPKAAMIMIGTNNLGSHQTVEQTIDGIKCVVSAVHAKLPNTKILLLAVFPRGMKADDKYRGQIKEVNEAIAKLDGTDNVKYLDIGSKFLDPDGTLPKTIMPDSLHPNGKGYEIWAEAVEPALEEMEK